MSEKIGSARNLQNELVSTAQGAKRKKEIINHLKIEEDKIMRPMIRRNAWLPTVFNDFFDNDFMPRANATAPAINVIETADDYTVELAAPGLKKEDFNVNINEDGNLVVKMEKKQEQTQDDKRAHYLRREFNYTKFEQTLLLPDDVEKAKIAARVEHGVLTVTLPKTEQARTKVERQIEIG